MVTCLEKTEENAEFHQIVDFLSTCSVTYALTVSLTIYDSYIEQFWNTVTSKTVNSVKQIHAIVDGKVMVISESSVRSDLLINDEDGIACLTNAEIFENLLRFLLLFLNNQLKDLPEHFNDTYDTPKHSKKDFSNMERKSINFSGKVTILFDSMLVQNQAPEVSHELQTEAHIEQTLPSPSTYQRKHRKTQKPRKAIKVTELPQTSVPLDLGADEAVHKEGEISSGDRPRRQETTLGGAVAQTRVETASTRSSDPPLSTGHIEGHTPGSDEGRPNLLELMNICTQLSNRVLALEEAKTTQDKVITRLKLRVRILEKKRKARTSQPMKRRLFKGRVKTSTDKSLGEYASKQGRNDIKTEEFNLTDGADTEVIVEDKGSGEKVVVLLIRCTGGRRTRKLEEVKRRDKGLAQIESDADLAQRIYEEELAELDIAQKEKQKQEEATIAALTEEFDEI
nr:hypothetical protein [Tanacetum cinerariifolium]